MQSWAMGAGQALDFGVEDMFGVTVVAFWASAACTEFGVRGLKLRSGPTKHGQLLEQGRLPGTNAKLMNSERL